MAWLTGFSYRKSLDITGASGAETGYQIPVRIWSSAAVHVKPKFVLNNDSDWGFQMHCYPKAIYYEGTYKKTYFTWFDRRANNRAVIQAFNHETREWGNTYVISTGLMADGHAAPVIGILPGGKLIVLYGSHTSLQYYKISTNPEDESSWGLEQNFIGAYSYPQPCTFSDKLVLFIRDTVAGRGLWKKNTTIDGVTWTGWVTVIDDVAADGGVYALVYKLGSRLMASWHIITGGNIKNLHFAYSDDEGETWRSVDGSIGGLPIGGATYLAGTTAFGEGYYTSSCLDENNQVIVTGLGPPAIGTERKLHMAIYSAPIGTAGSWTLDYMKDSVGTDLTLMTGQKYMFLRNGQLVLWARDQSTYKTTRFVRDILRNFSVSYLEATAYANQEGCFEPVSNPPASGSYRWEVFSCENRLAAAQVYTARVYEFLPFETHADGHAQADFEDIRFTDDDGTTLLDYWLEEKVDGVYADFWVEIADDLSADQRIYVYYGNPSVSSLSSGLDTFVEFDDFDDGVIDPVKWQTHAADGFTTISEIGGNMQFSLNAAGGTTGGCIRYKLALPSGKSYAVRTRAKMTNYYTSAYGAYVGFTDSLLFDDSNYGMPNPNSAAFLYDYISTTWQFNRILDPAGGAVSHCFMETRNTWTVIENRNHYAGSPKIQRGYLEQKEGYLQTTNGLVYSGVSLVEPLRPCLGIGDANTTQTTTFSYIAIRKYTCPEPLHEVWGSEELQSASANLKGIFRILSSIVFANLKASFNVNRGLDFSNSQGICFRWWGSGGPDQLIEFELETPTGSFRGSFFDGPAQWRWVMLSWNDLVEAGIDGSRPDKSNITGIYWLYHSSGLRRIDRIAKWSNSLLKARFILRHGDSSSLKSVIGITHYQNLKGVFQVIHHVNLKGIAKIIHRGSGSLKGVFEIPQGFSDLKAIFEIMGLKYKIAKGTTNISLTSQTLTDMTDMSLTVTTGASPILILAHVPTWKSDATQAAVIVLVIDGVIKTGYGPPWTNYGGTIQLGDIAWLEVLTAGEHTIKLQWRHINKGETVYQNGVTYPRMLMVIELEGAIEL